MVILSLAAHYLFSIALVWNISSKRLPLLLSLLCFDSPACRPRFSLRQASESQTMLYSSIHSTNDRAQLSAMGPIRMWMRLWSMEQRGRPMYHRCLLQGIPTLSSSMEQTIPSSQAIVHDSRRQISPILHGSSLRAVLRHFSWHRTVQAAMRYVSIKTVLTGSSYGSMSGHR